MRQRWHENRYSAILSKGPSIDLRVTAGVDNPQQQRQQHQDKADAKRTQTEEATRRHIAQPFLKQSMYDFLPPPSQSSAQPS